MRNKALLALEDGTVFHGTGLGATGEAVGEVVFNTAMTGYQEILTDPSYRKQIVTLTYPHVGNTGVNAEDEEAHQVHAAGLVIRDLPQRYSNWRSGEGLDEYLARHKTIGIAQVDTRKLTRILREKGAQNGCLMAGTDLDPQVAIAKARAFSGLAGMDLVREVGVDQAVEWMQGSWTLTGGLPAGRTHFDWHVVAWDYGCKRNILRMLVDRGCRVTLVPARTSAQDVLAMNPDGIFLSNGPGDPAACGYAIDSIRMVLDSGVPIFGICLGHQLLGLASGARTIKMKFGHHGANHPVQDLRSGKVMISSQNHGFAVDEDSLPDVLESTHRSLFDGSLQGIRRRDVPAFSFQGHPEASPGPHDVGGLFDEFVASMQAHSG
ncbi:MAG: glutamine-hydrolyzing carbamoyl-phosphate synthase small subunit [Halothiobacillaceae bacterium]